MKTGLRISKNEHDMIAFIVESTICLFISYGFYYLFLRHVNTFKFNRYYLLFSLLFAITIPFFHIQAGFNVPVSQSLNSLNYATGSLIRGAEISSSPVRAFTIEKALKILYFMVSSIFFIRFSLNILKLVRKTRSSVHVTYLKSRLVLVSESTLPYSFFNYIVVNRDDYENGHINKELLIHEQAHCWQYHSADIIAVELLKTVLWFNPLVWFFKKAIQLNHEYLADHTVLTIHNLNEYQHILVNLALRNNSAYLASDFNYSLTKKRLMMMTIKNSPGYTTVKRIAVIPLFVILMVALTFCEKDKPAEMKINEDVTFFANDWWKPILEKHDIKPIAYNSFEYIFEMGSVNSISNGIVTLKDAFFLIRNGSDEYTFIRSPLAYHDLEKNMIEGAECTIEVFDPEEGGIDPVQIMSLYGFKYHFGGINDTYEAEDSIRFEK